MVPSVTVGGGEGATGHRFSHLHRAACMQRGSHSESSLKADLPTVAIILVHEEWGNVRKNEVVTFRTSR